MKHSKLWTALALPLMLAACAKNDGAGVTGPDCLNISGEWRSERKGNDIGKFVQNDCKSISIESKEDAIEFSVSERETRPGEKVRVEIDKEQIRFFVTSGSEVRILTVKKISDDELEWTKETVVDGVSTNDPREDRLVRIKPAQVAPTPAELPKSETPNTDLR